MLTSPEYFKNTLYHLANINEGMEMVSTSSKSFGRVVILILVENVIENEKRSTLFRTRIQGRDSFCGIRDLQKI